jgi:DUF4097 and DUF4098 domain-containing protein YvlB
MDIKTVFGGITMKMNVLIILFTIFSTMSAYCGGLTEENLVNIQEIDLENINSVDIVYSWENITFFENDTNNLILKEYMSIDKSNYYAHISNSGDKILIKKGSRPFGIGTGILFNMFNACVEVYLPKSYTKNLKVKVSSGKIEGGKIYTHSEISLETSSGDISVNAITANNVKLKASSGNIIFDKINGNVSAETSSGNITIGQVNGNLTASASSGSIKGDTVNGNVNIHIRSGDIIFGNIDGDITAESSSGNIELNRATGNVVAKASSGSIKCMVAENAGDVSLTTSSGRVTLDIPRDFVFNFSSRTSSGRLSTPFSENLFSPVSDRNLVQGIIGNETASDDTPNVNIRTSSGSIRINWTE